MVRLRRQIVRTRAMSTMSCRTEVGVLEALHQYMRLMRLKKRSLTMQVGKAAAAEKVDKLRNILTAKIIGLTEALQESLMKIWLKCLA